MQTLKIMKTLQSNKSYYKQFGALTISKIVTLPSILHNSSGVKILESYIPVILVVQAIEFFLFVFIRTSKV